MHLLRLHWVSRLRVLAAALLVVFGAGQTLPAAHFLLVSHRVCAEHGELVHEEHVSSQAGVAASGAAESRSTALNPLPSREHAHDHCSALAPLHSQGFALSEQASVSLPPLCIAESAASVPRHAHRAIALLDYAPKLAPPSV
jgi:hypothetical protein